MKVAVGADHGGFLFKQALLSYMTLLGYQTVDLGAYNEEPLDDYPDFARAVAVTVRSGEAQRGILVCGSGVGASIAASKIPGIRAAVCHDTYSAHQGVEHDDMNVLCMGERVIGLELAKEIVTVYLGAIFSGEDRHMRRLQKIGAIEREFLKSS
ncbi:MAG TPA: ribose 5-phosphate isomerase B [Syntrophorhabdaceae bacterium]